MRISKWKSKAGIKMWVASNAKKKKKKKQKCFIFVKKALKTKTKIEKREKEVKGENIKTDKKQYIFFFTLCI